MKIGLIGFSTRNYIPYIEYFGIDLIAIILKKNLTNIQYMWFVNLE